MNKEKNTMSNIEEMKIRIARAVLNETASEFGKRFGLSKSYISRIENGQRKVPQKLLKYSEKVISRYYTPNTGVQKKCEEYLEFIDFKTLPDIGFSKDFKDREDTNEQLYAFTKGGDIYEFIGYEQNTGSCWSLVYEGVYKTQKREEVQGD